MSTFGKKSLKNVATTHDRTLIIKRSLCGGEDFDDTFMNLTLLAVTKKQFF